MKIVELAVDHDSLTEFSRIPISFTVESRLNSKLIDDGLGGIILNEEEVRAPYIKDYDAIVLDDTPLSWIDKFDTSNWALIAL